jgi:hypothetical protein
MSEGLGRRPVGRLERVAMGWNRLAVPSHRVNPLDINKLEQIHPLCLDRKAIQTKRDLLQSHPCYVRPGGAPVKGRGAMRDYWVLVKQGIEPEFELVPEAFSWGALIFQLFWALYRRLWWVSLGLVAVVVALSALVQAIQLDPAWSGAANVAVAVALGCFGNDFRRWELARKGYRAVDIVAARRIAEAEELAIARWVAANANEPVETPTEPRESELV